MDSADLVIEEPVEGGLTRLATFFESELPETVGPVRSVRISDIGLVDPVRATVVASGGAPDSLAAFEKAGVTLVTEGSPALGRDSTRPPRTTCSPIPARSTGWSREPSRRSHTSTAPRTWPRVPVPSASR